jgi:hypothetical protein
MSAPPPLWPWRLFSAAAAIAAALVSVVAGRFGWEIDSRSPLLWSASVLAALGAATLLVLAVLPASQLRAMLAAGRSWHGRLASLPARSESSWAAYSLLLLAVLAAGVNLTLSLRQPDDPHDDDQGAYLFTAEEIRVAGGLGRMLPRLFRGEFDEANRHPLYLGLLSLRPDETWGRSLSCGAALAAAVMMTAWLYCRYGPLAAGMCAVWTATNATWLFFGARVYCESLLMLTSLLAWVLTAGLSVETSRVPQVFPADLDAPPAATSSLRGWGRALALGGALALAWLTKGTGVLLLAGTLVAVVVNHGRRQSWRSRVLSMALVVVGFVVLASPLLTRNVLRYGSPFYNVNSQLLFVDAYADPLALAKQHSTAAAALDYWRSHSLREMAGRAVRGGVWEIYVLLRGLGRVLCGGLLALCAVVGLGTAPRFPWQVTVAWTVLLWGCFAWYVPIAVSERFLVPVLLPLLSAAAVGLERIIRLVVRTPGGAELVLVLLGWLWGGAWTLAQVAARPAM